MELAHESSELTIQLPSARVANGQLDDTDLTLKDLQLIRESFVATLKGAFHPRLE